MKKVLTLGALVAVTLVFSGCGKQTQEMPAEDLSSGQMVKENVIEKAINTVQDAMISGKRMKCTYTINNATEEGGAVTSEVYLDGERNKSITEAAGMGKIYSFYNGEDVYTWNEQTKSGMKINNECYADFATGDEEVDTEEETEEVAANPVNVFNNAFDVKCEEVGNVDWSLPEDVEFIDQCEMLKGQMNQIQNIQNQLPEGVEIPEGVELY